MRKRDPSSSGGIKESFGIRKKDKSLEVTDVVAGVLNSLQGKKR